MEGKVQVESISILSKEMRMKQQDSFLFSLDSIALMALPLSFRFSVTGSEGSSF